MEDFSPPSPKPYGASKGHIVAATLLTWSCFPFVSDTNSVSWAQEMFLKIFRNISCVRAARNSVASFCHGRATSQDVAPTMPRFVRASLQFVARPLCLGRSVMHCELCAVSGRTLSFTCAVVSNMAHYNFKKITVVPSAKVSFKRATLCAVENANHVAIFTPLLGLHRCCPVQDTAEDTDGCTSVSV